MIECVARYLLLYCDNYAYAQHMYSLLEMYVRDKLVLQCTRMLSLV